MKPLDVCLYFTGVVTIAIFLVTGEALLLNRKDILEGTDILAVCFTGKLHNFGH
jgi:hypothetical protein